MWHVTSVTEWQRVARREEERLEDERVETESGSCEAEVVRRGGDTSTCYTVR